MFDCIIVTDISSVEMAVGALVALGKCVQRGIARSLGEMRQCLPKEASLSRDLEKGGSADRSVSLAADHLGSGSGGAPNGSVPISQSAQSAIYPRVVLVISAIARSDEIR